MKSKIIISVLVIAVLVEGWQLYFHRIVSIKENAVAFADGTAEIVVIDNVPDQITHIYRSKTKAIWNEFYNQFIPPTLTMRGGVWQRMVYTFDPTGSGCDSEIFYMDRVNKKVKTFSTGIFCIRQTLDRDTTKFIAVAPNNEMVIGSYEDGQFKYGDHLPAPIWNGVTSNWENTKLAFPIGQCEIDSTSTQKIYTWDVDHGLKERTPKDFDCAAEFVSISYDHVTDQFTLHYKKTGREKEVRL